MIKKRAFKTEDENTIMKMTQACVSSLPGETDELPEQEKQSPPPMRGNGTVRWQADAGAPGERPFPVIQSVSFSLIRG